MRPIEEIRAAFHLIHRVATGHSTEAFMSIPANPDRDADIIVSAALDELEALRAQVANACMALSGSTSWATDGSNLKALCEGAMLLRHDRDETAKALARAQELQRGAEAQHCAALARVGELEGHLTQWQAIARENAEEVRKARAEREPCPECGGRDYLGLWEAAESRLVMAEARAKGLEKERDGARSNLEMYAKAWTRELGGMLIPKAHRIDALVLTTRALREALRELVRVMSHQLARGEDPEEGAFDRAWVAACGALAGAFLEPAPSRFDLVAHLHRQRAFSKRTFGPGERTAGVLDHIRKELLELEQAPGDLTEWIDVVLLAFDGAWRAGHAPEAIAQALEAKQTKNESRTWPDWRTAEPGKAIEHVRGEGGHG